ncbi:MAG: hypothetical protein LBV69_05060 [Bacteroidales bacterium]|jgi:hypothetical protein|nr:hypothetical protein [Bacteroidales bacterium]
MNNFRILLFFIACVFLSVSVKSQSNFYGTITYESFDTEIGTNNRIKNSSKEIIYINDKFVRIETYFYRDKGGSITIINLEDQSMIYLKKLGKYGVKLSKEELDSLKKVSKYREQKEIIYSNKTKKNSGYNCKQANFHIPNDTSALDLFYTTKMIVPKCLNESFGFSEIDGILLQYSFYFPGVRGFSEERIVTHVAKKIKKGKPDKNLFNIPEDYQIVESYKEFKKLN